MLFYLSFCDPNLPIGEQFLGACIVEAENGIEAVREAHRLGINPGGEVRFTALMDHVKSMPETAEYLNHFVPRIRIFQQDPREF